MPSFEMKLRRNARAAGALPGPISWGSLQHSHIRSSSIKGLLLDGREGRGEKVEGRERVGKKKGRKREKERGIGTPTFCEKVSPLALGQYDSRATYGERKQLFLIKIHAACRRAPRIDPGPRVLCLDGSAHWLRLV